MSSTSKQSVTAALGQLEHQVMDLVWLHAPCTAEDIRTKIEQPLRESTVRTVLHRLEKKGLVTHTIDNRTYVYRAAEARGHVAAQAVQRIVDWFCHGSMEELLTGMVDSSVLDGKELQRLAAKIAKKKEGAKS